MPLSEQAGDIREIHTRGLKNKAKSIYQRYSPLICLIKAWQCPKAKSAVLFSWIGFTLFASQLVPFHELMESYDIFKYAEYL